MNEDEKTICFKDHDILIGLKTEVDYLKEDIKRLQKENDYLKEDFRRLQKENDEFKNSTSNHFESLFSTLGKINPTLSSRDRATIIIAFISSIASIIIAFIHNI